MPLLNNNNMNEHSLQGAQYGFSAKRIDDLGASEYTLALLVVDASGSVVGFKTQIESAIREVVRSCRKSPRADNMMLRLVLFDNQVAEVHGYKPLSECHEDDYKGCLKIGGATALYDAAYNGVKSAAQYGQMLMKQDFDVNAAVFVITDGMDNASSATRKMVAETFVESIASESLESVFSVLIGVNSGTGDLNTYLRAFKKDAGFDQYIAINKASAKELEKLGGFVSKSIAAQSQSLGTGGPSQGLSF